MLSSLPHTRRVLCASPLSSTQDLEAHRLERGVVERDVPQAWWERRPADLQGVLHPRAVELDQLPVHETVHGVRKSLRDHRPGHVGRAGLSEN